MWHLIAWKISVSLLFLNWLKNEMVFLSYLWININLEIVKKIISFLIQFKKQETKRNFIGCQVPQFMIVLIPYINLLNLYWIKMSILEE